MEQNFIGPLIRYLQHLSGETVSILLLILCIVSILGLLKFYGYVGLYLYNVIAVITANIQVLKLGSFSLSTQPIALGTVIFATCFLVSDLLTEHWGKKIANRGVILCFIAQLLVTVIMIITLGYTPSPKDTAHQAMETLFSPSPRLFIASLTAFSLSQFFEISLFQKLSQATNRRFLWLRTSLSSSLAALLDTILFSTLAWVVLSSDPIGIQTLILTYILGTYVSRFLIAVLSTPVLYLSYYFLPLLPEKQHHDSF